MEQHLTLSELNSKIKNVLKASLNQTYWVIAEISNINFNQSGHCYLELIEKDSEENKIIAKVKANIWSYALRMIKPYFETSTGQNLTSGIKVLVNAGIEFHEIYGLSINIINIDPSYTIGDMERRKREIINKLSTEGVIDMNKEIEIPLVPQKIAIISSATAAGYEDFTTQLNNNNFGYKFYYKFFPAYMQGEKAEESIIKALDKIYNYENIFDIVVIIRGGGSQSDLNCFNNYWLAYNITQFPLPVLTGIGHERDETIVDIVANKKFKTPTAVAEFLIDELNTFDASINENHLEILHNADIIVQKNKLLYEKLANYLINKISTVSKEESMNLNVIGNKLTKITENIFLKQDYLIIQKSENLKNIVKYSFNQSQHTFSQYQNKLKQSTEKYISKTNFNILLYQKQIESLNPKEVLKRGYSLTYSDDELVTDIKKIKKGQILKTILKNGDIVSVVKNTEK